jgi:uncharacterized SAM-binding protein YcdF (DUF218 family)
MSCTLPISRSKRPFLLLVITMLVFLGVAVYTLLHAGTWLIREDPLQKSQAIIVLSGALPERALSAAELYCQGYAQEIWLTHPLQPGAAMEDLRLPYAGEEQYSRMVLIEKGVPAANIRILKPPVLNTADELRAVSDALDAQPGITVIVVTSKPHTRRVHTLWKKIANRENQGHLLVRAALEDHFDAAHWWRSSNDALNVTREYLGLLNASAGLPLPHSQ